jgi:hypothetical protein
MHPKMPVLVSAFSRLSGLGISPPESSREPGRDRPLGSHAGVETGEEQRANNGSGSPFRNGEHPNHTTYDERGPVVVGEMAVHPRCGALFESIQEPADRLVDVTAEGTHRLKSRIACRHTRITICGSFCAARMSRPSFAAPAV